MPPFAAFFWRGPSTSRTELTWGFSHSRKAPARNIRQRQGLTRFRWCNTCVNQGPPRATSSTSWTCFRACLKHMAFRAGLCCARDPGGFSGARRFRKKTYPGTWKRSGTTGEAQKMTHSLEEIRAACPQVGRSAAGTWTVRFRSRKAVMRAFDRIARFGDPYIIAVFSPPFRHGTQRNRIHGSAKTCSISFVCHHGPEPDSFKTLQGE